MNHIIIKNINNKNFIHLIKQMVSANECITFGINQNFIEAIFPIRNSDDVRTMYVDNSILFESIKEHDKPIIVTVVDGNSFVDILERYSDVGYVDLKIYFNSCNCCEKYYSAYKIEVMSISEMRATSTIIYCGCDCNSFLLSNINRVPKKVTIFNSISKEIWPWFSVLIA